MENNVYSIGDLNKGRHLPDKVRTKISERVKELYKNGRTAWNKGKPMSEETKLKVSQSRKGIAAWNKGKSWSDEVKEKISKTKKGFYG